MNERMQREMDKLWESKTWNADMLENMKSEHLRTAYK